MRIIDYKVYIKILGFLTLIEGLVLFPCSLVARYYEETAPAKSLMTIAAVYIVVGLTIFNQLRFSKIKLKHHEGWLIAFISWFYCSVIGTLPYFLCGQDYSLMGSFFEAAAGFTTTGCSAFDMTMMPRSLILWKAATSWMGGMGILVLMVSVFSTLGVSGQSIASAEITGPIVTKLDAKYSDTGKFLYLVYICFTVVEFLFLLAPMGWYEALVATFSSISTGGLVITPQNEVLFTSPYVRFVIMTFTVLASLNFLSYFFLLHGKVKEAVTNVETRTYFIITASATLLIAFSLKLSGTYSSLWQAIKDSLCQVVSFIGTSGYYVCDYTKWPTFTIIILFTLIIIGGCSLSTSGSLKIIRVAICMKLIGRGIYKQIHPRSVKAVIIEGKAVPALSVSAVTSHVMLYFGVLFLSFIVLSLNNFDMETTITTAIGLFSNTGVALGEVGISGYVGMFNGFSQFFMSLLMIMGRLEIYAVLILFSRSFWKVDRVKSM